MSRPSSGTDALSPGTVDVRLLTMTPRLDGLRDDLPPNRARRAVELVAYLALHQPDVVTSDRLRTRVLGSSDADAAAKTLFNTAYAARRAMGLDEEGNPLFPTGTRDGLYQLSPQVTVDVERAVALCAEAKAQSDPQAAIAFFRAALSLVEGEPLANALSGYAWWEAEGHGGRIAATLVDAACLMAPLASEEGLFDLARWGLEQARFVEPYSEALSRAAMQVAAAEGDADRLRLEWRDCQRRIDALDPGASPSARTESLYGELSRRVLVGVEEAAALSVPDAARLGTGRLRILQDHVLQAGHPASLDEGGVTRAEVEQQRDGVLGARHLGGTVEVGLETDHFNAELLGRPGDAPMLGLGFRSQLGHQSEQRQLAPIGQGSHRSQRGLGRRRVGVVAVDDQHGAVGDPPHLHAEGRPGGGGERGHHALERSAAPQRRGGGGQRIRDLLDAVHREAHLPRAPRRRHVEPRPEIVIEDDALRAHVGVGVHRVA